MSASSDVHKALNSLWFDHGLDWAFKKMWEESDRSQHRSLHDLEAPAGAKLPYCVYSIEASSVDSRSSDGSNQPRQMIVHNLPLILNLHTGPIEGSSKTAKQHAVELMDQVLAVIGGHPTTIPQTWTLDNGCVLNSQFLRDHGIRTGDDEYQWVVEYNIVVDAPMFV